MRLKDQSNQYSRGYLLMRAYVCGWGVLQCRLIQIPETLNGHAVFCYLDFQIFLCFRLSILWWKKQIKTLCFLRVKQLLIQWYFVKMIYYCHDCK